MRARRRPASGTDTDTEGGPVVAGRAATGSRHSPALLDMLADTALDADYTAARRRPRSRRRPAVRLLAVVALGLVVVTGVVQTARSEPAARQGRADLVEEVVAGQDALAARRTRVARLQRELARLDAASVRLLGEDSVARTAAVRVDRLAAATQRTGPGLRVVADDAPGAASARERVLDKDLQRLVNALWASGAEAIAINGVRLTALSAIRTAGEAVTVDYRSVRAPYELLVLGEPNQLQTRFVATTHGQYWYDLQAAVGVTLELTARERVTVPPARRLDVRRARADRTDRTDRRRDGGTTAEGGAGS